MKMRKTIYKMMAWSILLTLGLSSCSDWVLPEKVGTQTTFSWEEDADTWNAYFEVLNVYKERQHSIVYASFHNADDQGDGELNYMRNLPDSLDIVSLTNADRFSGADREDLEWMHRMGTKVLYQVDYAGRQDEFKDEATLGAYLDRVVASVTEYGLDGFSFTGHPDFSGEDPMGEKAASLLVDKLDQEGKLLVFEGNPQFVAEADRERIDYYVLDTRKEEYELDVKLAVQEARQLGIRNSRILLSAGMDGTMTDSNLQEVPQLEQISSMVLSQGPLAGMALYGLEGDYYHPGTNYAGVRRLIQKLNPSR